MFEAVFRDSPDGIIVVEADSGAIIQCNRAVRDYLGCDPERLVGRPLDMLLGPGEPGRVPLFERVRLHGAVIEERELARIDGSFYPMHLRAGHTRWGEHEAIIVTLRDVRDRRDAHVARRLAEAKYHSIFEHAVEGIFQTTPDGHYISANPALARIYGYGSAAELIERLTDIAGQLYVDPTRRDAFHRILEANDVVRDFESEVYRKDGTVTWISENARAVRDASGRLRYYEGTVVDISMRKLAEEARRSEVEVARALARVGREMLASFDTTTILERLSKVVADVLPCERMLLWTLDSTADVYRPVPGAEQRAENVIQRVGLGVLVERLAHDQIAILDSAMAEGLPSPLHDLQQEGSIVLYFGIGRREVPVSVLSAVYHRHTDPFTPAQQRIARGVAHLASVALEHARMLEELERANRLKSEFVATISHEFRTPINVMAGYHDMLLDDGSGSLSEAQRDIVGRLGRTTARLADLVNSTLDLSRLEAGKLPVNLGAVSLGELFPQIERESQDLVREKPDVSLRWDVPSDLPMVHTDPAHVKVILKNLIDNAVKFTERGVITVMARPRLRGVELAVEDTGIGIAPETLTYIFEAFRQADGSMTRRHEGVGLGLHLVQRFVDLIGGTVSVKSTPGVGSTFRVWLPSHP